MPDIGRAARVKLLGHWGTLTQRMRLCKPLEMLQLSSLQRKLYKMGVTIAQHAQQLLRYNSCCRRMFKACVV